MRYRTGRRGRKPRRPFSFLIATPSYLQAGAPSEVAIPAGSAPSLTKIEHVTFEPPTRLLFVIVASHPPPGVLIPRSEVHTSELQSPFHVVCGQPLQPTM